MQSRQRRRPETFLTRSRLRSLDLTFARVASLDVSGDADNGQGVDARQAEKQGEETVYLEEKHREWIEYHGRWPFGAVTPVFLVCFDFSLYQMETPDQLFLCL